MMGVAKLTTIEIDTVGQPDDLEAVIRFHTFRRPVDISWDGGFEDECALLEFAQGTLKVYSGDGNPWPQGSYVRTRTSSERLSDGVLRFSQYDNQGTAKWHVVHVLLPRYGVASYLDPFDPGSDDHVYVRKHDGLDRTAATFVGGQHVTFKLQLEIDRGRWETASPDHMFRPPSVDRDPSGNAESFVRLALGKLSLPVMGR